ncbi:MAG: hypothetical protein HYZ68_03000, partial [Chloroflexi bacterium]|nr:hypothetical protein [Chloroflexota bacterium]
MESLGWVALAWLLPIGLILLGAASVPQEEAPERAAAGLLGIVVAILGYALLGFGFQFGGLGLVSDLPGAEGMVREWGPLDTTWGLGWGVIGLGGFDLLRGTTSPELTSLFIHQAALLASSIAIPALALSKRLRSRGLAVIALLVGVFVYPIFGNWAWGGGWLSQLGNTLDLGYGFVDFAGAGAVHVLGATLALSGLVVLGARLPSPKRGPLPPPPAHLPLLGILGGFAILVGWFGLAVGNPLA